MSALRLRLPTNGGVATYTASGRCAPAPSAGRQPVSRQLFAAAHVVADPRAEPDGTGRPAIDWEATLAFRRHLWSCGLGVADAMDTAQRGWGLDWDSALELVRHTAAEAPSPELLVAGVATDHLVAGADATLDEITAAYREQCAAVEDCGARAVVMASRHLAGAARHADDYLAVYAAVLASAQRPVVLHWLGAAFDPALTGYWGSTDLYAAGATVLEIIRADPTRVDGVKLSTLDLDHERWLREQLPEGVRLYTGDDFHYDELILGDDRGHSDALLGVFDPIASVAQAAVLRLDADDVAGYQALLGPTVPLARHLFAAPTYAYKTGVVFLAYLAGHQDHFVMVSGAQGQRSVVHLAELFRLADAAGLFPDPASSFERMRRWLAAVAGWDA